MFALAKDLSKLNFKGWCLLISCLHVLR